MNILKKTPRLALLLAIFLLVWFAVAMFGAKLGMIDKLFAFGTMTIQWGMIGAGVVAVLAIIGLVVALISKPKGNWMAALLALLVPLGFAGGLMGLQSTAGSVPFIYDITTNTADAPQFSDAMVEARADSGENVNELLDFNVPLGNYDKWAENADLKGVTAASLIADGYPDLETLTIDRAPADAIIAIKDAMDMRGFQNVTVDEDAGIVEGTAVVFWYGFEDDVVARVRATETGSSIDFRSTSRLGTSDLGVNAERITDLSKAVEDRLDKDFPKMEPVVVETPESSDGEPDGSAGAPLQENQPEDGTQSE
ncbi:DUF1499 domain-containing protein [Pontixanthobacter aestiaquae]|uniref:DUF1499 domain-containing protein n=1 Tax=Pontixanthobacter aestiaquae TaxID=1509367 RepID=A0A844Z5U4_9SPHN|nr:DUF1499 domain-containing protein [Pontixanthobacter aestiaquae]MDN3644978.1 DUF1499 domain-containing protein [Pontixanthobacter aestiaquae]MXO84021.1 DUF1499 domain-containing protein [Pontixanthobacter aestiaquae]